MSGRIVWRPIFLLQEEEDVSELSSNLERCFQPDNQNKSRPSFHYQTTVMAQVDSSVGGKTGINHPYSIIDAVCQPQSVLIDTDTLNTLPDRELASGFAEVIKYAVTDGKVKSSSKYYKLAGSICSFYARKLIPQGQKWPGL